MEKVLIALDSYDDIFSDFDIGPYETRLISADFLTELKKKIKKIEPGRIILTLPSKFRDKTKEHIIIKRLREFFRRKEQAQDRKFKESILFSFLLILTAILLVIFLSLTKDFLESIFYDYLIFPSWYISWKGLDKFFSSLKLLEEKNYFKKLQKAAINFEDEEKYVELQTSKLTTEIEKTLEKKQEKLQQ